MYQFTFHLVIHLFISHPINVPLTYKSQPIPPETGQAVKDLVGLNFKEVTEDKRYDVAVNFYAPWCPWSRRLQPIWQQLGEKLKGSPTMIITKFDGSENEVPGLHLHGFPTIALYRSGDNEVRYYRDGVRTVDALLNFLKDNAGITFTNTDGEIFVSDPWAMSKTEVVEISELTDDDFQGVINDPNFNVLVLFYGPRVGQDEETFETWKKVGVEYQNIASVKVLQMDAVKHTSAGVSVFPIIKLFPAGQTKKEDFPNGIQFKGKQVSLKNIAEFIAENARRTPVEESEKRSLEEGGDANKAGSKVPTDLLRQTLILKNRDEL
eukprot:TRINITY_DN1454_c0_g1_i1.p1 TRINITY_DN1454_c0_g1~~TRINITY_DN1454_c0_g1_i1.p1  ORF type:complete len:322 (+),score=65.16 TRINITY_DN1454_c0_g1_i1:533-1498(+)